VREARGGYADDDAWIRPELTARPKQPGKILAASIIWIVFGSLILLRQALNLLIAFAFTPTLLREAVIWTGACPILFAGLIGGVFIHVGIQSIQGTAKDTLGNGIGSIIFAVLVAGIGIAFSVASSQFGLGGAAVQLVVGMVEAAGLLTAGILALVARDQYRAWRYALKGGPPRRPR
jgi:hypothetical protein